MNQPAKWRILTLLRMVPMTLLVMWRRATIRMLLSILKVMIQKANAEKATLERINLMAKRARIPPLSVMKPKSLEYHSDMLTGSSSPASSSSQKSLPRKAERKVINLQMERLVRLGRKSRTR